ncbi:hypothetical protein SAMD00023353_2500040 [Rosellinia necatrix]|uniref:Uncharacterized protein n=1 Tax=Rosellinia necatrix TaxID=77044 RepID=A0A1W2TG99_ROSNE|nr:hypothetical protein SAMD00023353_2500040 [Rosellinia necatrix]
MRLTSTYLATLAFAATAVGTAKLCDSKDCQGHCINTYPEGGCYDESATTESMCVDDGYCYVFGGPNCDPSSPYQFVAEGEQLNYDDLGFTVVSTYCNEQ